jgi:glycosyltransferase involved in cell wall biosynthesis
MTEDFLGHFAEVAVANSVAGQNMLIDRGYKLEKTRVIYNALELKRLEVDPVQVEKIRAEHGIKPGQPVVGIAAWISPVKDHASFIKAASIILKSKPEARFAILGEGLSRPDLEVMVEEMRLTGKVVFLGRQSHVGNYLALFDISVLSSIDHEGCSNSILESMYLGKPIIATDVGGNKELVIPDENGFLVPPKNPEALAQAILQLINDPEKARKMGENGRARILAEFRQERMVEYYQDLWLKLLEKKAPVRSGNHAQS